MNADNIAPRTLAIRDQMELQERGSAVLAVFADHGVPLFEDDLQQIISFLEIAYNKMVRTRCEVQAKKEREEMERLRMWRQKE